MSAAPSTTEPAFVDANVFLRYLTDDVPEQAAAVATLLTEAAAGRAHLVTRPMVVAEIVWTLESYYGLARAAVAAKATAILNTPGLEVGDADLLHQAVADYVELNVDFGDAYNMAWMLREGLSHAVTFDRRHFSPHPEIVPVEPGAVSADPTDRETEDGGEAPAQAAPQS